MSTLLITTGCYTTLFYCSFPNQAHFRKVTSLTNALFLTAVWLFTNNSDSISALNLNNYITGFFAYDLIVGHLSDRENFNILTGYIHHSVYIALLTYLRHTNESYLIYYFLPFEIPTVLLDIKRIYPSNQINATFGISFLLFRVFYNAYVINAMPHPSYAFVTILMLNLHMFWFYQWSKKHFLIKETIKPEH